MNHERKRRAGQPAFGIDASDGNAVATCDAQSNASPVRGGSACSG
jgi:hypothetical protein